MTELKCSNKLCCMKTLHFLYSSTSTSLPVDYPYIVQLQVYLWITHIVSKKAHSCQNDTGSYGTEDHVLKKLYEYFQLTLHAKNGNVRNAMILLKPIFFTKMENIVIFLTQKCLTLIVPPLLLISKKCASSFRRETTNEIT